MNSSSTMIPEPLGTSNPVSFSETARENQENTSLPPFNVLIKWLSYYHTETGTWPEPVDGADLIAFTSRDRQSRNKPPLTIVPNKAKNVKLATGEGFDIAGMVDYDFRSSIYYRTAEELGEKHTPAAQPLNETSTLVLSSFLALCHHPAFLTESKDKSNERGLRMYLPLDQWGRVLKVRKATLGSCLKELEAVGLIKVCTLSDSNYTKAVKRHYCLAVILQDQIPVFKPKFSTQEYREPVSNPPEPFQAVVPPKGTGSENNSMHMVSKTHDSKINKYKTLNHEHGQVTEAGTVEEKLEFLAQKATFPGFTSPDGLIALASGEALKFASNPDLDLFTLKRVYNQVLSAWTSGKCTRNPIGFFHYTLTQRLKQREAGSPNHQGRSKIGAPEPEPLVRNWNHIPGTGPVEGTSFFKAAPVSVAAVIEDGDNYKEVADYVAVEEPDSVWAQSVAPLLSSTPALVPELEFERLQCSLKDAVIEALEDRFKQPDLARVLSQCEWEQSFSDSKFFVKLVNMGVYTLSQSGLTQGQMALLKIAISQKIRYLTGSSLEIDITI